MLYQIPFSSKPFVTLLAFEFSSSKVGCHVPYQTAFLEEILVALLTLEFSFARVNYSMSYQKPFLGKVIVTPFALGFSFSPVWTNICFAKDPFSVKFLSHWSHLSFFGQCELSCALSNFLSDKTFVTLLAFETFFDYRMHFQVPFFLSKAFLILLAFIQFFTSVIVYLSRKYTFM